MSSAVIGSLRVVLGMDSAAFNDGVGAAQKRVSQFSKAMGRAGRDLQSAGQRMTVGLTAPLIALAYKSVAAQREQERAIASVTAALQSMGHGAGYTLAQLEAMAAKLQDKSLYGDEEILSKVTANLLTFGNVQGEVFERAQQVAVDLSARLGQDLQSSAIMLGKALNDPIKGLTALSRVGVSFSEQQKEQIKAMAEAGDVAGAQALMLAELERQYKGQAEALANTDSGKITQALNSIGDAAEKIGAIVLPIFAELATKAKIMAEKFQQLSPEFQKFSVIVGAVVAAAGPLVFALGGVVSILASLLPLLASLAVGVAALTGPFGLMAAVVGAAAAAFLVLRDNADAPVDALEATNRAAVAVTEELFLFAETAAPAAGKAAIDLANDNYKLAESEMAAARAAIVKRRAYLDGLRENAFPSWIADPMRNQVPGGEFNQGLEAELKRLEAAELALAEAEKLRYRAAVAVTGATSEQMTANLENARSLNLVVNGLDALGNSADQALDKVASGAGGMKEALKDVGDSAETLEERVARINKSFSDSFAQVAIGARSFGDVMRDVLSQIASSLISSGLSSVFRKFGFDNIFGMLPGFATGGSFEVGGAGGVDSQVVAFRASPNETVHITKPGQGLGAGPKINFAPVIDARGADSGAVARIEAAMARAQQEFAPSVIRTVREAQKKRHL